MKINTPQRVRTFDRPSVWLEFSPLSQVSGSINLGQGFPDCSPPDFIQEAAAKSVVGGDFSKYARSAGHPHLVKAIAEQYRNSLNREFDPNKGVLVTVGASEALFLSIMAFVDRGDEVIVIEPAFDLYYGVLAMAGAHVKPISLIPNKEFIDDAKDLVLDWNTLEKQLTKDTKAIIINTPHNPTGKVFSKEELTRLADLLGRYPDCLIISDEVYEHLVYDGKKHLSIASLEGMFERTLSIFSAGKTFSITGWKVGWIIGPQPLIKRLQLTQQWVVFSVSTPHQEAVAIGLSQAQLPYKGHKSYYDWLREDYEKKRNLLYNGLLKAGLNPIKPEGSFFILSDILKENPISASNLQQIKTWNSEHKISVDENTYDLFDYNFCRGLSINKKVTSIPVSAFYTDENKSKAARWARFAFCKENPIIEQAIKNLISK